MNKNIEDMTEELMMRYVEGDLDSEESEKFQRILAQNEYLNKRVSMLKSFSDNQPAKSPPRKIHSQILSDIGISNNSDISFIKSYINSFMGIFDKRPILAGSFLSIFIVLLAVVIIYSNMDSSYNDHRHITDDPIEKDKNEDLEDDLSI